MTTMENTSVQKKRLDRETLRWLVARTRPCLARIVWVSLGDFLLAVSTLLFAMVSRGIIDSATARRAGDTRTYGLALVGIILAQMVLRVFISRLEEAIRWSLSNGIRQHSLGIILGRAYGPVSVHHSGELINRLTSDVQIVADGTTTLVPTLVSLFTRLLGAMAILIYLDPLFAGIFLLLGLSFFVLALLFRTKLKNMHREVQESEGRLRSYLQEAMGSLLIIKVFGARERILRDNAARQAEYYGAQMRRRNFSIMANTGFYLMFQAGYLLAMMWGAQGLYAQTMTFGTFIAIIQIIGQVQGPLSQLSGILPRIYGIFASAERLIALEEIPAEVIPQSPLPAELHSITFSRVSFSYGRTQVLEDVSYRIRQGDFVAVTGLSGGGKSTQFLLMLGAYLPQSGTITIDTEVGVRSPGPASRSLFAYVPQGNYLFSGTVRENIAFLRESADEAAILEAARMATAHEFIGAMPQGYDTLIGEKGYGLSEGQAQRIAIARALLSGAPVLLLDEATSALDEATEAQLLRNISSLKQKTCILVTHRQAALSLCNLQLTMNGTSVIPGSAE